MQRFNENVVQQAVCVLFDRELTDDRFGMLNSGIEGHFTSIAGKSTFTRIFNIAVEIDARS